MTSTSISQEDENFVRQSLLLTGVAPRAVRVLFDREFPPPLRIFISTNRTKVQDLYIKRILNGNQWTLLNGNPNSTDLDITLMICLLRNISSVNQPITGFDQLPSPFDLSEGADLARIKYYRNAMAHKDNTKISNADFAKEWTVISEAIGRLGGTMFTQECQRFRTMVVDQSNKTIMMEIRSSLQEIESIKKNKQDVIPLAFKKSIQAIKTIWEEKIKAFAVTQNVKSILTSVIDKQCVIISGPPGSGKSIIAWYVALELEKQQQYDILPVSSPSKIIDFSCNDEKQLFLFDDVLGKYFANQSEIREWGKIELNLKTHLKNNLHVKLLMTCRTNIYETIYNQENNNFLELSVTNCSLISTELKYTLEDYKLIAEIFLNKDTIASLDDDTITMFPFFPLLCSLFDKARHNFEQFFKAPSQVIQAEINEMKNKSDPHYFALCLLVIFNDSVDYKIFQIKNKESEKIIKDLYNESRFTEIPSKKTLACCMKNLMTTYNYVKESCGIYSCIHDKIFDIVAHYVGSDVKQCIIKNGASKFIFQRLQFESVGDLQNEYTILLDEEEEKLYFERLVTDISKGHIEHVFNNCQMKFPTFRKSLIEFFSTIEPSLKFKPDNETSCSALHVIAYLGYSDVCQYLLSNNLVAVNDVTPEKATALAFACLHDQVDTVEVLLNYGAAINQEDVHGITPLHSACSSGCKNVVEVLLKHNANINQQQEEGATPLNLACFKGHTDIVEILLNKNAALDLPDKKGKTPLCTACAKGHTDVVEVLLKHNAEINKKSYRGFTPIKAACRSGNTLIVDILPRYNVICNEGEKELEHEKEHETPLNLACNIGEKETVEILLKNDTDTNQESVERYTPLSIASFLGHFDIVKLLLANNALVDEADNKQYTALHRACQNGQNDIVNLLLKHNSDINRGTIGGSTPLYFASQAGHVKTVDLLLTHHALVNKAGKDKKTPLVIACIKKHQDIVKLLLKHNALVNEMFNEEMTPLHIACLFDNKDVVELLLQHNAAVNQTNFEGSTPLILAMGSRLTAIVELLLTHHASVNTTDKEQSTPLHFACYIGFKDAVELLLKHNAIINQGNLYGATPLYFACKNGYENITDILLKNNADVHQTTDSGRTPLHIACENGHADVVNLLVSYHASANTSDKTNLTPLHLACLEGHFHIVENLLKHNALVNKAGTRKLSPMHIACEFGYRDIVELLLTHNADADQERDIGTTALSIASTYGHTEIVELLLTHHASVNKANNEGITPLHNACFNGHIDTVEVLLKHHALVNIKEDTEQRTPLHIACLKGHKNIVEILTKHDVAINERDRRGYSPLSLTCHQGDEDTTKLLLQLKADVEHETEDGFTPLFIASSTGHTAIVEILLTHHALVNKANKNQTTSLLLACTNDNYKVVEVLLKNNADINLKGPNGTSPLHIACIKGHKETVKILLNYNADINQADTTGTTPLHTACLKNDMDLVNLLLQQVLAISQKNKNDIILKTCTCGHMNVVKYFLEQNINLKDIMSSDGKTLLHLACLHDQKDLVELLLNHHAAINHRDHYNWTPVHIALFMKRKHIIEVLSLHASSTRQQIKLIDPELLYQRC